jgi:hypothetical protein
MKHILFFKKPLKSVGHLGIDLYEMFLLLNLPFYVEQKSKMTTTESIGHFLWNSLINFKTVVQYAITVFIWDDHWTFSTRGCLFYPMFCFAEEKQILSRIENRIPESDWKKRFLTHFRLPGVVDKATTYHFPLNYICLSCLPGCLPRQQIVCKTSKLFYYFYIVITCLWLLRVN